MKQITLLGLGRSSVWLAKQLDQLPHDVKINAFDINMPAWATGLKHLHFRQIDNLSELPSIDAGSLLISLLPPSEHVKAAQYAIACKANLITASYLSDEMQSLDGAFNFNNTFSIHEAGLDPGIDHITALHAIHFLKQRGIHITDFASHCGGLPSLVNNNPWGYKFFWSPLNILHAGKVGARYIRGGREARLAYSEVFAKSNSLIGSSINNLEWYANRDSLPYQKTYSILATENFVRGTLRYKGFCDFWSEVVAAGLTSDEYPKSDQRLYQDIIPVFASPNLSSIFDGWHDILLNSGKSVALNFFEILLTKWSPTASDHDRVIMVHQIKGFAPDMTKHIYTFELDVEGNENASAMSLTVGLPIKLLCDLWLSNNLPIKGCTTVANHLLWPKLYRGLQATGLLMSESFKVDLYA